MAVILTKTAIDAAVARGAKGERVELADDVEPGLRLRAGERGAKWSVLARTQAGERIRVPLGTWPGVAIKDAREAARDAKKVIEKGGNPNIDRKAAREHTTVRELLGVYDSAKLATLRTGAATKKSLDLALKPMLDRDPLTITRRDVAGVIDKKAKTAPVHANRMLAYLRAFFGWAVGRGHMIENPAEDISKPAPEVARDRTPNLAELEEIWTAAGTLGYPFGLAVRVMMVTAARREEVAAMRVAELNLRDEAGPPCWTLPAERSKNGRSIRVPLPPLAHATLVEALQARPNDAPLVFTTTGETSASGWSKAKVRLDATITAERKRRAIEAGEQCEPLAPWRLHDLRRSFATLACDVLHIDPAVADRCLNHVGSSTTSTIARVYGRSEMFDQRKAALDAWASLIEAELKRSAGAPPAREVAG